MAEPNGVEIVEVCKVASAPSTHNPSPKSVLPLTFFDLRSLRFPATERLFFYAISSPNATSFFFDSILPRLKHSLSLTLLHYPPVAGSLTWPPPSPVPGVEYSESDTVSLTVAKSTADHFHRLSGSDNVFCAATEFRPLIPNLSAPHNNRVAVLAIQVTVFPNHGFSIGVTAHHAFVDGKSFIFFMKSWAHICGSLGSGDHGSEVHHDFLELPPELRPVLDRTYIKDPSNLATIFSNRWLNIGGPDNRSLLPLEIFKPVQPDSVRGIFQLPRGKIEKLKRLVSVENMASKDIDPIHVSTFSVTCAYTWICLAKAEDQGINDNKILVAVAVDCRSRLDPPIPTTYFGHCVVANVIPIERETLLRKEGLLVAVKAIHKVVKDLDKGLLNEAVSRFPSYDHNTVKTFPRVYSVASSPRFEVYKTDFGWGKPKRVDVTSIDRTGAISLSDNPNGDGGVEIGVVLRKHHMEAFASLFAEGLEAL